MDLNCFEIQVLKLQEGKGDYKKEDIAVTQKMTTAEKALLLDKKKKKKTKENVEPRTPKATKKKDKSGKFQMKISGFLSPPQSKKATSPDSGFNSRSETPAVEAESKEEEEEKEEQNDTEEETLDESATEETEMADEKKKFLEDLEESDVEKEKSNIPIPIPIY